MKNQEQTKNIHWLIAAKNAFFSIRGMRQVFTVFLVLVAMCFVFGMLNPNFFKLANVQNLLRQIAPILIIGIAQSFVLITGGIDLSIGSVVGMSGMIAATIMTKTALSPFVVVCITLIACCILGAINGFLIARCSLPPFIATLGTMIIARGIAQWVNGGYNTNGITNKAFLNFFYYGTVFGVGVSVWIALILACFFGFILSWTTMGRHTYAIGSNREAARLSGVNVAFTETRVYVFSSLLAGIAGIVFIAQTTVGFMDGGTGYELDAVASSVLGGVSTMGGQGILLGTVIGASILGVVRNGLTFAGAPLATQNIATGVVIIVAVLTDRFTRRADGGKMKKIILALYKKIQRK